MMKSVLVALIVTVLSAAAPITTSWLVSQIAIRSNGGGDGQANFEGGRAIFNKRCSVCHQLDREGPALRGPRLHEIGKVAAERKPGMTATGYLLESLFDPAAFIVPGSMGGMPQGVAQGLSTADIRELIGFLSNLGGSTTGEEIKNLEIPADWQVKATDTAQPIDLARVMRGEALFRGRANCISCHALRPDPGFTLAAPSLLDAASLPEERLRVAILTPNATLSTAYQQATIQLIDGRVFTGRLLSQSETVLQMLIHDSDGAWRTITVPLDTVERNETGELEIMKSSVSSMPVVDKLLSTDEVDDLVMFLRSLKSI